MKIYTKTGDDGSTGLIGGSRVLKHDPRIECYGTVDELNAIIGLAAVVAGVAMADPLRAIQAELFVIGSHLAMPEGKKPEGKKPPASLPALKPESIARLENEIDGAEPLLQPLQNFILPGGSELAARLHVARTVCRRAERLVVALSMTSMIEPEIVVYLNRLSDWCFVHARQANHLAGIDDVPWVSGDQPRAMPPRGGNAP